MPQLTRFARLSCLALVIMGMRASIAADPKASGEPNSIIAPLYERFAPEGERLGTDEIPNFQKHVSPLLGRLGCNGRACHGSFQGQGGFQLSLFGYDFDADHKALLEDGTDRVDLSDKLESLILTKPVDADLHDGGKRFEFNSWQYWVLRRWIEADAPFSAKQVQKLERLEVTPTELSFHTKGETQQLKVVAHWEDGTAEDVTCLSRFQSNDTAIAEIDETGLVTCGDPGDTHVVVSYDNAVVPILVIRPLSELTGEKYPQVAAATRIDELVVQKLQKLGILPSEICTDEEFLRRASLDLTGTLPSAKEVITFLEDPSAEKRKRKVEELLERPAYAAQWTTFLCDITGNNEDQLRNFLPQTIQPANQWYQWIYQRVADNVPYDQIVEGIVTATSRLPDESYPEYCEAMSEICRDGSGEKFADRPGLVHYWARNNFRTPEDRAIGFAYSFLGVRIQCAQCHKHPFDQWAKSDFDNFEKLFAAVQANQNTLAPDARKDFAAMISKLGIDEGVKGNNLRRELGLKLKDGANIPFPELTVRVAASPTRKNNKNAKSSPVVGKAKLLGGDWLEMDSEDVRGKLMEWLRDESNPYFAKAIVNRIWAHYFGVGIVNPADDLNLANAPSNAPLLNYLAEGFVSHGYDMKWLHREIVNSDTYQRSWVANESNRLDHHNFSHAQLKRLPAETAFDAVQLAVFNDEFHERSARLEVPRALTKSGASAQSNNNRDPAQYALTVFGRSVRESNCDCDRSNEPSLLQTVFLANDQDVLKWLSDPKTSWVSSVASKFDWELPASRGTSSNASEARLQQLEKQVENYQQVNEKVEARIREAQKVNNSKAVATMRQQQQERLRTLKNAARKNGLLSELQELLNGANAEESPAISSLDAEPMTLEQAQWIAENAYLRTLSRKPADDEKSTAVAFLTSDPQPTQAVEGLLWSLINTKEFILNH